MNIEKGIPIPGTRRGRRNIDLEIPFASMDVGDSVLVRSAGVDTKNLWSLVKVRTYRYAQESKRKFTTSKVEDGIRIWRTA